MKPYQRVASRYIKAKYQKGNITIKPSTNYASESATLGVELLEDGEYMGHCEASVETYTLEDLSHFVCGDDIEKLSEESEPHRVDCMRAFEQNHDGPVSR